MDDSTSPFLSLWRTASAGSNFLVPFCRTQFSGVSHEPARAHTQQMNPDVLQSVSAANLLVFHMIQTELHYQNGIDMKVMRHYYIEGGEKKVKFKVDNTSTLPISK